MQDKFYRYSYNEGETGGLIIANSLKEAKLIAAQYLAEYLGLPLASILTPQDDEPELLVWKWTYDDYYNEKHPAVFNCYGE